MKKPGSVYQISPDYETNKAFAACMFVLTEDKGSRAMGYVQALGENRSEMGGRAYIFIDWEFIEYVGQAVWVAE